MNKNVIRFVIWLLLFTSIVFEASPQKKKMGNYNVVFWNKDYQLSKQDFMNITKVNSSDDVKKFKEFSGELRYVDGAFSIKKKICGAESFILLLADPQKLNGNIIVNVLNVFIQDRSWYDGEFTKELLSHEQIHFDISEYFVRLMRRYLSAMKFETITEAKAFVETLIEMYDNTQVIFDIESENGNNYARQNEWKVKINAEIESLEEYARYDFTYEVLKGFEEIIIRKYSLQ